MKRILLSFLLAVLAAGSAGAIKIIHGPYLQNVKDTEATIVWISDSVSVGWVEIAPDDGTHYYACERGKYFDSRYGIKTESRIHAVKIKGLKPGCSYRYRVYAKEVTEHKGNYVAYGKTAATDVYRKKALVFKTLDKTAESVSFAMVCDIHSDTARLRTLLSLADAADPLLSVPVNHPAADASQSCQVRKRPLNQTEPQNRQQSLSPKEPLNQIFSMSPKASQNQQQAMNQRPSPVYEGQPDMVLFVGDMVSVFESEEQVFGGFMDEAVRLFASQTPMYYTRGNHETRGRGAYSFQDYFSPHEEHLYYMYRQGPVCFIALDCGEDKPDTDLEYYGITMYDSYRDEQAEWLKRVLQSEEFLSAPFRVVTCHMPPTGGWHGEREIEKKFIPLLEAAGVDIMLCGHLHKYQHRAAGEIADFPVVVNASDAVLKAKATSESLSVEVLDVTGKLVDSFQLNSAR